MAATRGLTPTDEQPGDAGDGGGPARRRTAPPALGAVPALRLARAPLRGRPETRGAPAAGPLRRRLDTLATAYRRRGVRGVALVVAEALPDSLLGAEWFALFETDGGATAPARPPGVTVRWATRDDLDLLTSLGRSRDELVARFEAGDRVCMALRDGGPVGYFWFRADSWREGDVEFAIPHGEVWGYDAFVAPHARGGGIHPRMASWAARELSGAGVRRYLSGIDYTNEPSLRSAAARGARRIGSILVIRMLGLAVLRERWEGRGRPAWRLYRRRRGTTVPIPSAPGPGDG